ncbi:MAG: YraN family protein [Myxococcota bacterium]
MSRRPSHGSTTVRGAAAEELAADYLRNEGYRIVARNHRCAGGELDLVAWDGDILCFIEVRSRASDAFGDPLETITPQKIRRVVRAARDYLEGVRGPLPEMRFDAVGIVINDPDEPPRITLVRGAFDAS